MHANETEPSHAVAQITRMLRLNKEEQQHVAQYQKLDAKAKQEGFGALFRSPTVWEDLVKSILLCNCGCVTVAIRHKRVCRALGCHQSNMSCACRYYIEPSDHVSGRCSTQEYILSQQIICTMHVCCCNTYGLRPQQRTNHTDSMLYITCALAISPMLA